MKRAFKIAETGVSRIRRLQGRENEPRDSWDKLFEEVEIAGEVEAETAKAHATRTNGGGQQPS